MSPRRRRSTFIAVSSRHIRRRARELLAVTALLVVTPVAFLAATPSAAAATAGLDFRSQTLPGGTAGVYYSAQIQASGGTPPYTFSLREGTIPPGLSLSSSGVVSGTPDEPQVDRPVTSLFDVNVIDSGRSTSPVYGSIEITITPSDYQPPPPMQMTTTSVPNPQVNKPYSFTMQANGGTLPYTWYSTNFPPGFSMNTSGTITGSASQEEQETVTVDVNDSSGEYLNQYQWVASQVVETTFTFTVSSGISALDPTLIVAWDVVDAVPGLPDTLSSALYGVLDQLPGGGTPGGTVGYVEGEICDLTTGVLNKSCL